MENTITLRKTNIKNIVMTGMLGALSTILMLFEISVPFAPTFVKFDFSYLPFNLLKYGIVSVITFLAYKKISILFK